MFPQNTVKLLEELKSTSNPKHVLGLRAELLAIKHYIEKGFILKSHRERYFKTEVDLVVESPQKLVLIEVKYTTHKDYILNRLSQSQRRKLESVFLRVIPCTSKEVEFHLVIVDAQGELEIFEDFLA